MICAVSIRSKLAMLIRLVREVSSCAYRRLRAADNELSEAEKKEGWILLFDGKTLDGWMTSSEKPSQRPVEHAINPHKCGGYMMIHEKPGATIVLSLDFKISKGCNSGIFIRTFPLTPRPGKDVGFNGLEVAIDDTRTPATTTPARSTIWSSPARTP